MLRLLQYKVEERGVLSSPTAEPMRRRVTAENWTHAKHLLRISKPLRDGNWWEAIEIGVIDLEAVDPQQFMPPAWIFKRKGQRKYSRIIKHCDRVSKHSAHMYHDGDKVKACDGKLVLSAKGTVWHRAYPVVDGKYGQPIECDCATNKHHTIA